MRRAKAALQSHPRLLALVFGAIAACAFQPLGLWPLGLLGLAGLGELVARSIARRRAFMLGWLFGLAHFSVSLNWIATAFSFQAEMPVWLGGLAVVGLAAVLAVFPALAALGAWLCGRGNRLALILALAGSWIVAEWLRSWVLTGFPWNPVATMTLTSFGNPGLAVTARWLGTFGLSGLVVLVSGAWLLAMRRCRADWKTAALVLGPIALMLAPVPVGRGEGTLAYTLVQANLSQDTLHDTESDEDRFQRAARLSLAKQPGQRRVVLWSESGVPDLLKDGYPKGYYGSTTYGGDPALARGRLGRLAGDGGLLLTGNDDLELRDGRLAGARNSVTVIDQSGAIRGSYYKSHLVPFGEYVPFRAVLEPLGIDRFVPGDIEFWPGPGPRTIDLGPWGKVGVGICYEIVFPGAVVNPADRPDYIYNPSNDGWYGSWGPPQHLAQTRLRAIEEGLPVLRSTTTGISAVVDADGVVREWIGLGLADRRDGLIPPAHPPTWFARSGNVLSLGWAIALLVLSLVARRRRLE